MQEGESEIAPLKLHKEESDTVYIFPIIYASSSLSFSLSPSLPPPSSFTSLHRLTIYQDLVIWPSGAKPDDGSEKCVVEGFRNFLHLTCTQAVVVLCTICFGGLTLILLVCFFIFKRRSGCPPLRPPPPPVPIGFYGAGKQTESQIYLVYL